MQLENRRSGSAERVTYHHARRRISARFKPGQLQQICKIQLDHSALRARFVCDDKTSNELFAPIVTHLVSHEKRASATERHLQLAYEVLVLCFGGVASKTDGCSRDAGLMLMSC